VYASCRRAPRDVFPNRGVLRQERTRRTTQACSLSQSVHGLCSVHGFCTELANQTFGRAWLASCVGSIAAVKCTARQRHQSRQAMKRWIDGLFRVQCHAPNGLWLVSRSVSCAERETANSGSRGQHQEISSIQKHPISLNLGLAQSSLNRPDILKARSQKLNVAVSVKNARTDNLYHVEIRIPSCQQFLPRSFVDLKHADVLHAIKLSAADTVQMFLLKLKGNRQGCIYT
jgi:hypothetical protein